MITIFVVDDNDLLLSSYQEILKLKGYDVIAVARNGLEAIEVYKSLPIKPEIIIMDHRMPVKSGIDAIKRILQIKPNAKVIFASADTSVKNLALSMGAAKFLVKPFQIDTLIGDIKELASTNE